MHGNASVRPLCVFLGALAMAGCIADSGTEASSAAIAQACESELGLTSAEKIGEACGEARLNQLLVTELSVQSTSGRSVCMAGTCVTERRIREAFGAFRVRKSIKYLGAGGEVRYELLAQHESDGSETPMGEDQPIAVPIDISRHDGFGISWGRASYRFDLSSFLFSGVLRRTQDGRMVVELKLGVDARSALRVGDVEAVTEVSVAIDPPDADDGYLSLASYGVELSGSAYLQSLPARGSQDWCDCVEAVMTRFCCLAMSEGVDVFADTLSMANANGCGLAGIEPPTECGHAPASVPDPVVDPGEREDDDEEHANAEDGEADEATDVGEIPSQPADAPVVRNPDGPYDVRGGRLPCNQLDQDSDQMLCLGNVNRQWIASHDLRGEPLRSISWDMDASVLSIPGLEIETYLIYGSGTYQSYGSVVPQTSRKIRPADALGVDAPSRCHLSEDGKIVTCTVSYEDAAVTLPGWQSNDWFILEFVGRQPGAGSPANCGRYPHLVSDNAYSDETAPLGGFLERHRWSGPMCQFDYDNGARETSFDLAATVRVGMAGGQ